MFACKKISYDKEILAINDMKTIVWDMTLADEWFNQISNSDSLRKTRNINIQLYEQVFASHNITKKNFYTSYQYYQLHPDKMKILIDSVSAYGERIKNSYKGPRKY
ncbi:MAG: DUF4296 domain-containing protein [Deinococcales bacterium]|nr:DUF4296 domain-containing protein [Chitinophagaceae bacterium]